MTTREPSLFSRLVIRVGMVLLIVASILISAAGYYAQTAANKTYDQLLRGAAMQIADGITQNDGKLIVNLPLSAFELLGFAERDRIFYRIVGPDGAIVSGYPDLNADYDYVAARYDPQLETEQYRGVEVRVITVSRALADQAQGGWIYVILAQTTEARRALAAEITQGAILIVGIMILLGLGGTFLAVRYALKPVTRLALALRQRNPEDLTTMEMPAPQELQPFLGAINHFMRRLDERVVRLQQFIADAAHQIRTPLTGLSAQVDMLDEASMIPENRERTQRIKIRTGELAQLTNQLLSHAMVIHRSGTIQLENINLVAVARTAFHHAVPLTVDPDMVISFEADEALMPVKGDPVSLREAIANIISNALRHGAVSRLDVRVMQHDERICVEVEDDGPGIPPEKWDQMSRRFNATSPNVGTASGLGFAIAAEVAVAHGGLIRFREKGDTGFTVILDLPCAGEDSA
ncbi:sensor histidine kinase [Agrobacterium sp. O3.4]|uniref:histidine kinase n=1 Tax=Agrobacterium cucumeris TaxID=2862866 RepID=A0ABY8RRT1_9HYPH|nr:MULTISPECIES: sensor histidine kinase [Rhizobium/Agrobacterium group]MCZ7471858.1 sensor histidine kinase [Rhizobium rhizogenes]WHO09759.1 sensor histidine kinase [Agrobacterium cucumeris]